MRRAERTSDRRRYAHPAQVQVNYQCSRACQQSQPYRPETDLPASVSRPANNGPSNGPRHDRRCPAVQLDLHLLCQFVLHGPHQGLAKQQVGRLAEPSTVDLLLARLSLSAGSEGRRVCDRSDAEFAGHADAESGGVGRGEAEKCEPRGVESDETADVEISGHVEVELGWRRGRSGDMLRGSALIYSITPDRIPAHHRLIPRCPTYLVCR